MNSKEKERLDFLISGNSVPVDYIQDYYGVKYTISPEIEYPLSADFDNDYNIYHSTRNRIKKPQEEYPVDRIKLEEFMQHAEIVPKKWMACELGMNIDSLERLMFKLSKIGLRKHRYEVYDGFIDKNFDQILKSNLPNLKYRSNLNHQETCQRIHLDLEELTGIKVSPWLCENGEFTCGNIDCITLKPISLRDILWIDFHNKPMMLTSDRISEQFYIQNRDLLKPYIHPGKDEQMEEAGLFDDFDANF